MALHEQPTSFSARQFPGWGLLCRGPGEWIRSLSETWIQGETTHSRRRRLARHWYRRVPRIERDSTDTISIQSNDMSVGTFTPLEYACRGTHPRGHGKRYSIGFRGGTEEGTGDCWFQCFLTGCWTHHSTSARTFRGISPTGKRSQGKPTEFILASLYDQPTTSSFIGTGQTPEAFQQFQTSTERFGGANATLYQKHGHTHDGGTITRRIHAVPQYQSMAI